MTAYVIVGDPDPTCFAVVRDCIRNEFGLEVIQARTFNEVRTLCIEHLRDLDLVLLTGRLPDAQLLPYYFHTLAAGLLGGRALAGYLNDDFAVQFEESAGSPDLVLPFPKDQVTLDDFRKALETRFFKHRLPGLKLDDDPLLREQVRSLDWDQSLEGCVNILRRVVGGFFREEGTVYRLRSGRSGASVFRLKVRAMPQDFIVKLSRSHWKLLAESANDGKIAGGISGLRVHKPALRRPRSIASAQDYIVSEGGWHGICFSFLGGGPFGPSLDLQQVLTARAGTLALAAKNLSGSPSREEANAFRIGTLQILLDWLKREWCMREGMLSRISGVPWSPRDAEALRYEVFPPYKLTSRTKGRVLGFLESSDAAIGRRLLHDWEDLSETVKAFVLSTGDKYRARSLDDELSMVRSPAHGDLNSSNVLFCLHLGDPIFLIDFATYQESGHALQDFARLEAEIIYGLLDRQEDSDLAGLDYTPSQFDLWRELTDHLFGEWAESHDWTSSGSKANVAFALALIQATRKAAEQVQRQQLGHESAPTFFDEYMAPLLYYSLLAITHSSLSPFKRILAVYCSAMLLRVIGLPGSRKSSSVQGGVEA